MPALYNATFNVTATRLHRPDEFVPSVPTHHRRDRSGFRGPVRLAELNLLDHLVGDDDHVKIFSLLMFVAICACPLGTPVLHCTNRLDLARRDFNDAQDFDKNFRRGDYFATSGHGFVACGDRFLPRLGHFAEQSHSFM